VYELFGNCRLKPAATLPTAGASYLRHPLFYHHQLLIVFLESHKPDMNDRNMLPAN
jgi:hypothetical protein